MSGTKIKNLSDLLSTIRGLKKKGRKIVFTNGCFDILHYGHVMYLEKARKMGDILIVGVNSDSSIRKIKGAKRPLVGQRDRARIIAALKSVDYVIIFKEKTPLQIISKIKPDILIKGADWKKNKIVGASVIKRYGGKACTVEFSPGRSTTNLIKKIVKIYS
ncbi:MAG: D-glycero-beta-D-manno-heptose 1-phosphate adenylyltransferase [Candidatus Omnitrophota bacterium]